MFNIISLTAIKGCIFWIWYISLGRALSSPPTPHQVLKIKPTKTTKYHMRTTWPLSLSNPASAKYATLGIRLWAACQRFLTSRPSCLTKMLTALNINLAVVNLEIKASPSTSPPSPLGSTCRKSTLLLMLLLKESQGYLHPGKDIHELPPHLRYCILSTRTPPISFLLFIRTGPLKFEIWTLSITWRSKGSL